MTESLKIIATPIGNLQDISMRAKLELQQASIILAEDTRHTKSLVSLLGLNINSELKWYSCNSYKEKNRLELVIKALTDNKSVVLVSDAGTPCISDPGSLLIKDVVDAGYEVKVIPGACAITAAIMGSGLDCTKFAFLGFLPHKKSQRERLIKNSLKAELSLVIYEAPSRVVDTLSEIYSYIGKTKVVVAREITKLYESFHRGYLGEELIPPFVQKGECVIIIEKKLLEENNLEEINYFIKQNIALNKTKTDIALLLQEKFSISKSLSKKLAFACDINKF